MISLAASRALCIARKYTEALMDPDTRCLTSARSRSESVAYSRPDQNWEFCAELLVMPAPSSAEADSAICSLIAESNPTCS